MNLQSIPSVCSKIGIWENRAQFKLTNVDYRLVNALRHVLLEEIPCLAFHTFRFECNNTVLKHEQIMHTLRMVRVSSKAIQELKWTKDCECEKKTCEFCSVRFDIDVVNTTENYKSVTTDDLIAAIRTNCELKHSVKPMHRMEIVKLAPEQALKLTAFAQIGIGREHGKWVCVPTMIYQGIPLLSAQMFHTLPNDVQCDIVAKCPKQVFSAADGQLDIEDLYACTACDECTRLLNLHDKSQPPSVELSNFDFQIKIETDGRHSIHDTLQIAFDVLKNKCQLY